MESVGRQERGRVRRSFSMGLLLSGKASDFQARRDDRARIWYWLDGIDEFTALLVGASQRRGHIFGFYERIW